MTSVPHVRDRQCATHIERVFEVKVVVAIEVTTNKVVDLGLGSSVEVLELVHRLELDDVETVGKDAIRLPFEKVLGLVGSDVRDGGEYVSAMGGATLDAVAVIDATFAGFVVDVKVLEIVVKIDAAGAEVATEESGMCGKDGGNIDVAFAAEGDRKTCLPFVEVGDDGGVQLARDVLFGGRKIRVAISEIRLGRRGERNSRRRGTKPRCSQTRSSRWFHDRWGVWGCRQGSRGRPSTRRDESTGCRYRKEGRVVHPRRAIDRKDT